MAMHSRPASTAAAAHRGAEGPSWWLWPAAATEVQHMQLLVVLCLPSVCVQQKGNIESGVLPTLDQVCQCDTQQ